MLFQIPNASLFCLTVVSIVFLHILQLPYTLYDSVFGFLISSLTQAVIESGITAALGRRKLFKDISQLKDHYIICGAGRVGLRIIDELEKKDVDFVIIERDEIVAERLLTRGHLVLIGDATDDSVLLAAGITRASAVIAALSGETCVDYSLRLKHEFKGPGALWVAGYSNDILAYIPSRRVLLEGGYEAFRSLMYWSNPLHPDKFADTLEERIISTAQKMMR